MVSTSELLRLVVDPVRLAVLGKAAVEAVDTDRLARQLGVRPRVVREAVGRLRTAGLLDDSYRLRPSVLRRIALELPQAPPASDEIVDGLWSSAEIEILGRFFTGSRLMSLPSARSKRRVVLERLVQEFEPGVRYAESEVNFILQMFNSDYAALRRSLVDEELLTRADGVYWRTGGRYEPEGEGDVA